MKGWQIFWQSVLRVFNNFGAALRISLVPYAIIAVVIVVLLLPVIGMMADRQAMTAAIQSGSFPWGSFAIAVIVGVIGTLWIAVAWHRYVLIDEASGIVPPFRLDRIIAYFLRGLLIGIIMIPVALVLSLIFGLIIGAAASLRSEGALSVGAILSAVIVVLPIVVIATRLATSLPGAALGTDKGIRDAWAATKGQWGAFIVLGIILAVAGLLSEFISSLLVTNSVLLLIWSIVYGWVSAMVGISILTTLYGHYIEGRSLD